MPVDIQQARAFLHRKEARRQEALVVRYQQAWQDFRAIVGMIAKKFCPARIYQWGSLLDRRQFCEWSDIDLAVEGLVSAEAFFDLYRDADQVATLPLDLVEMERIEPEFADIIRMKGVVVYERDNFDPGPHFRV